MRFTRDVPRSRRGWSPAAAWLWSARRRRSTACAPATARRSVSISSSGRSKDPHGGSRPMPDGKARSWLTRSRTTRVPTASTRQARSSRISPRRESWIPPRSCAARSRTRPRWRASCSRPSAWWRRSPSRNITRHPLPRWTTEPPALCRRRQMRVRVRGGPVSSCDKPGRRAFAGARPAPAKHPCTTLSPARGSFLCGLVRMLAQKGRDIELVVAVDQRVGLELLGEFAVLRTPPECRNIQHALVVDPPHLAHGLSARERSDLSGNRSRLRRLLQLHRIDRMSNCGLNRRGYRSARRGVFRGLQAVEFAEPGRDYRHADLVLELLVDDRAEDDVRVLVRLLLA